MIDEFMVLNNDGIALYYHNFIQKTKKREDYQLIAGFLDQISQFTKFSLKEPLKIIEWGDLIFFFFLHDKSELRLVFKCDNTKVDSIDIVKRPIEMMAKNILNKFLAEFEEQINDFKGEISQFNLFSKIVDKIVSLK